jgi:hypothetical protein
LFDVEVDAEPEPVEPAVAAPLVPEEAIEP